MRTRFAISSVFVFGLILLSGCGASGLSALSGGGTGASIPGFAANDAAKALFANSTWGSADNTTHMTFNSEGQLTGLLVPNMPPELANLRLDGQPFSITLPADIPVIGGKSYTTTLVNTSTSLNSDGSLQMVFMGNPDAPLLQKFTLVLGSQTAKSGDNVTLSGLSGSFSVTVLDQNYPVGPQGQEFTSSSTEIVKQ